MKRAKITGLEKVLRNLNKEIKKIEGRTKAGLWEAALAVRYRAQELTPVETGHLKGFVSTPPPIDTPRGPSTYIAFHAEYAVYVHEINANYTVGQWKFLETALRELKGKVLDIIKRNAKIR